MGGGGIGEPFGVGNIIKNPKLLERIIQETKKREASEEVILCTHNMNEIGILLEPQGLYMWDDVVYGHSLTKIPPFVKPSEAEALVNSGEAKFENDTKGKKYWFIHDNYKYCLTDKLPQGFKSIPVPIYLFNNIEKKD